MSRTKFYFLARTLEWITEPLWLHCTVFNDGIEINELWVPSCINRRVLTYGRIAIHPNAGFNTSWVVPWFACFLGYPESLPGFSRTCLTRLLWKPSSGCSEQPESQLFTGRWLQEAVRLGQSLVAKGPRAGQSRVGCDQMDLWKAYRTLSSVWSLTLIQAIPDLKYTGCLYVIHKHFQILKFV